MRLYRLPDGQYVDPAAIYAIRIDDAVDLPKFSAPPRVTLRIAMRRRTATLIVRRDSLDAAQALAADLDACRQRHRLPRPVPRHARPGGEVMDAIATGRPWAFTAADEAGYPEFDAWERWMRRHLDDALGATGEDGVLDALGLTQKIYLFDLMARLADGTGPLDPCLATPDPEDQPC